MKLARCRNLRADLASQARGGELVRRAADAGGRLVECRNRSVEWIDGKVRSTVVEHLGENMLRVQRRLVIAVVFELREVSAVAAANDRAIVEFERRAEAGREVFRMPAAGLLSE